MWMMTAIWMLGIILNSELKALSKREWKIAQKGLFLDQGRADVIYR